VVAGVGSSTDFEIREDVWRKPFTTSLRGYYYMRIGEDPEGMTPVPRRPRFLPGRDPEGFTVYLTDLDPFDPEWDDHPGDTWDEPHFKPAAESMFRRRRLPGNPTNPNAYGGHADALDWDRHLAHVSNIYDLLLPYLISGGLLDEDDLGIAESGNGIPDLIDEARNEVDLFLRLRDGEAYAHGLTNPSEERTVMFQAGTTTMAAWANAANAAMLADALRVAEQPELVSRYRDEAITAFRFAERQGDQQLDDRQDVGDAVMRGRDFRMMAAAFLYNVTGDRAWERVMAEESVARDGPTEIEKEDRWVQTWGTAAYLFTPRERHRPELAAHMRESIHRQALENNVRYMDLRPSRRSSNRNYWRTAHNLQLVILAHALSEDVGERTRFHRAMVLEADWGLGRNPSNIVEMTGLGSRHIVNCYTSGRNDGTPGLHPGHTPYNNLDPWSGSHNGSNPRWFTDRGYPDWEEGGWPEQESHFNSRYSWANAEFTPRQTMRGKMALYAYLYALTKASR
jgi:endoglucanase